MQSPKQKRLRREDAEEVWRKRSSHREEDRPLSPMLLGPPDYRDATRMLTAPVSRPCRGQTMAGKSPRPVRFHTSVRSGSESTPEKGIAEARADSGLGTTVENIVAGQNASETPNQRLAGRSVIATESLPGMKTTGGGFERLHGLATWKKLGPGTGPKSIPLSVEMGTGSNLEAGAAVKGLPLRTWIFLPDPMCRGRFKTTKIRPQRTQIRKFGSEGLNCYWESI